MKVKNIEQPTSNLQRPAAPIDGVNGGWMFDVGCWMLFPNPGQDSMSQSNHAFRIKLALLGLLVCLTLSACKPASDTRTTPTQKPTARAPTVDNLVQQATTQYQQRIQQAASAHAANASRMQEARVLEMAEVTQRQQLEPKREVVRQFLASNQTLKSCLAKEEALFLEELKNLGVPPARIDTELRAFQSVIRAKAVNLQMRDLDQQIGEAMLGALDFLAMSWGLWNYSKDYSRVQFDQPGALGKYNEFMETIEAATKERDKLRASPNA
jgi:hypothetical protein